MLISVHRSSIRRRTVSTSGTFSLDTSTPSSMANNSSEDLYDIDYGDNETCDKDHVQVFGAIFTPLFFSIVVILSLFGNILVLVILVKYEKLKSLTSMFLLNLVVSDLLFTTGLPFWAYSHVHGWTLGDYACKATNFIFYTGYYSSGFLLVLMTVHRYMAVMKPLSDVVSTTSFDGITASFIIWLVSAVTASPAVLFTKVQDDIFCVYQSTTWNLFGNYQQNVLFLLISAVFIFCYGQIACKLSRLPAKRRGKRTVKLIFTLVLVFFVGWGPYNIILFLKSFEYWTQGEQDKEALKEICEYSKRLDYSLVIGRFFAFSQCWLNPVFYVFVGVKFKSHLRKLVKGFSRTDTSSIRSRKNRHTITSITSGNDIQFSSKCSQMASN